MLGVRDYLNEHGPGGAEALLAKHISEEAAFQCTTCGACEDQCPVGIQHLPIIVGLRRGAVNTGKWEDEYGAKLFLNLERNGNPMGFASSDRQKFVEKNELPIYDGSQEYCLWLGCMGAYDPQGREIVLSLVAVLKHLGVTFGVLRKERCNGDPARRLGNDLLFSRLAEPNIEHIGQSNVKKMLSICPHCVRTIGEDWREFGATVEIEHHSVFLARMQSRLPANPSSEKVVFHDPCYLGTIQGDLRRASRGGESGGRGDRPASGAESVALLRRGRRAGVPGRGEGEAGQRGSRGRVGRDGRSGDWRGVPLLPDDVPRCTGPDIGRAAEAAGYRADCRDVD